MKIKLKMQISTSIQIIHDNIKKQGLPHPDGHGFYKSANRWHPDGNLNALRRPENIDQHQISFNLPAHSFASDQLDRPPEARTSENFVAAAK